MMSSALGPFVRQVEAGVGWALSKAPWIWARIWAWSITHLTRRRLWLSQTKVTPSAAQRTNSQPCPHVLPPRSSRVLDWPVRSGDAVAGLIEPALLLDIDVDHVAGMIAFTATDGLSGIEVPDADAVEAGMAQHPADGGGRDADLAGDLLAGEAFADAGR